MGGVSVIRRILGIALASTLLWGTTFGRSTAIFVRAPWETIVADAGFVGVVECEQAGGVVAKYRVLDSWKGPLAGSHLWIAQRDRDAEYPLALCGERYFFVADSAYCQPPEAESVYRRPAPWCGAIPQYESPWAPARIPPPNPRWSQGVLEFGPNGSGTTVESFRPAVLAFVTRDEELLELRAIRAAAAWPHLGATSGMPVRIRSATRSDSLDVVLSDLLGCARQSPLAVSVLFSMAGREETLRRLRSLKAEDNPFRPKELDYAMARICRRLGLACPVAATPPNAGASVSELMGKLRGPTDEPSRRADFDRAVTRLIAEAPDSLEKFLIEWDAPRASPTDDDLPYRVASYFAQECPAPRTERLRALFAAREALLRVAGAVYLCYEDEKGGRAALRTMTALPGDAGAWAALTLARRGDQDAVPRALELLRDSGPYGSDDMPHRVLRKQLIELFSNSAAPAHVRLPLPWSPEYSVYETDPPDLFDRYTNWWRENRARIRLRDPWLLLLAAKRAD